MVQSLDIYRFHPNIKLIDSTPLEGCPLEVRLSRKLEEIPGLYRGRQNQIGTGH